MLLCLTLMLPALLPAAPSAASMTPTPTCTPACTDTPTPTPTPPSAIIEVDNITLDVGQGGSVGVRVRNIPSSAAMGMGTYTIWVYYDNTMVDITGIGSGDSWWGSPESWSDQGDHIRVVDWLAGCPGPGSGNTRLFDINFDCTGSGNMTWEIDTHEIADCRNGDPIPYIEADGWCYQVPAPTPTPTLTPTLTATPTPCPVNAEQEVDTDDVIVTGTIIQTAPGGGTVESYDARAVYSPALINIVAVRDGDAPFTGLINNINNTAGNATFSKSGVSSATPCRVARLVPRLVGNAGAACSLQIHFDDISGSTGSGNGESQNINYRRGDASGDGKVSIKDAMVAAQYIAGNRPLGEINAVNLASVNHDTGGDEILGSDDMFIAQYIVDLRDAGFNWTG